MVHSITLFNTVKNIEILVDKTGNTQYILDEIEWDKPAGTLQTYRIPFQIGLSLLDVEVGTRAPVISGYVIAKKETREKSYGLTWEEYFLKQNKDIEEAKIELNKVVNMFQDLRIYVGDYYLEGRPTAPVVYGIKEENNNEILCYFTVTLECVNPMFRQKQSRVVNMSQIKGMFVFPWRIKKHGNVMGRIERQSLINVINAGDCDVGGLITFRAKSGTVVNPRVFNATTGEFIEIDITVKQGDRLSIDTRFGHESVTHYDVDAEGEKNKNAIMYVKEGSTFLQFRQGSWIYGYEVEEGTEVFVDIDVDIDEQFYTIKEQ